MQVIEEAIQRILQAERHCCSSFDSATGSGSTAPSSGMTLAVGGGGIGTPTSGGTIVAVTGSRSCGKTTVVLRTLRQDASLKSSRESSGMMADGATRKRSRIADDLADLSSSSDLERSAERILYLSCQSFAGDTVALRRAVVSLLEAEGDERASGSLPLSLSLGAMGSRMIEYYERRRKGGGSANSTPLLHVVLDDADYLTADDVVDVECWLSAVDTYRTQICPGPALMIWFVSQRVLNFRKQRVLRLVVPTPSPETLGKWYGGEGASGPPVAVPPTANSKGTLDGLHQEAMVYYLTKKPTKDSIVAMNAKLLHSALAQRIVPQILSAVTTTPETDPHPHSKDGGGTDRSSSANAAPAAGTTTTGPTVARNVVGPSLYAKVWEDEVRQEKHGAPTEGQLLSMLPFSAKVLYVTCFYCGAVPPGKDNAVLSRSDGSLVSVRAKRMAARLNEKSDGSLLSSSQSVPLSRLQKCYEALGAICQNINAGNSFSSTTGPASVQQTKPLLSDDGGVNSGQRDEDDAALNALVMGTTKDVLIPFSMALHHLSAFESWGVIQWMLNNRSAFYSHIPIANAERTASSVGLDLYQLIPNVVG